jgi:hypothetical protein
LRALCRFRESGKHIVSVFFNDRQIDRTFVVNVIDSRKSAVVSGDGLKRAIIGRTSIFDVYVEKGVAKELALEIIGL